MLEGIVGPAGTGRGAEEGAAAAADPLAIRTHQRDHRLGLAQSPYLAPNRECSSAGFSSSTSPCCLLGQQFIHFWAVKWVAKYQGMAYVCQGI